jgi:hypothetical protein
MRRRKRRQRPVNPGSTFKQSENEYRLTSVRASAGEGFDVGSR